MIRLTAPATCRGGVTVSCARFAAQAATTLGANRLLWPHRLWISWPGRSTQNGWFAGFSRGNHCTKPRVVRTCPTSACLVKKLKTSLTTSSRTRGIPSGRRRIRPPKRPAAVGVRGAPKERLLIQLTQGGGLVLTLGCRACHSIGDAASNEQLFGGGDLNEIAVKRPAGFFERWLAAPQSINSNHRMPVFELTAVERRQIAAYLQTKGTPSANHRSPNDSELSRQRGLKLVEKLNCGGWPRVAW